MSTSSTATAPPVTESIVVDAPVERAFDIFTAEMGSWWPPSHHMMEAAEMIVEPRAGGNIIDRGADGSECRWARVLAFEPPRRFVFTWDISLRWEIETDPAKCSEVEVRFTAESPERTRVDIEHRHLERHGDGWESMQAAVGSPNGWLLGLERFADRVSSPGSDA